MKQMVARYFAFTGDHTLVLHRATERAVDPHLNLVVDLIPNQDPGLHHQIRSSYLYCHIYYSYWLLFTVVVATAVKEAEVVAKHGNACNFSQELVNCYKLFDNLIDKY